MHSATVAGQIVDVAVRVEEVRPFAVQSLLPMLADPQLAANARARASAAVAGAVPAASLSELVTEGSTAAAMAAVASGGHALYAAAWIVGEYAAVIPASMHSAVIDALLQPAVLGLPSVIPAVYVQATLKLLAVAAAAAAKAGGDGAAFVALASSVAERLNPFAQCVHVEVQERACLVQQLLSALGVPFQALSTPASEAAERARAEEEMIALAAGGAPPPKPAAPVPDVRAIAATLAALFDEPLKPVNPKAQRKVPVPAGLNLDAWIHPEEARNFEIDERPAKGGAAFRYENVRCGEPEGPLGQERGVCVREQLCVLCGAILCPAPSAASFEDSYGVADDEFAGRGRSGTEMSAPGSAVYDIGRGDEDDEEWFKSLEKQNKKEAREKYGGGPEPKPGKKGRESAAAAAKKAKEGKAGRGNDPYMLRAGSGGEAVRGCGACVCVCHARPPQRLPPTPALSYRPAKTSATSTSTRSPSGRSSRRTSRSVRAHSKPALPTLPCSYAPRRPAAALTTSIFHDFAEAPKPGKKGKKKKAAAADDDDDAPPARSYVVADDEDMPQGESL